MKMVEKHDRIWAIYPEYFDSGITRHLGRRIRKELAQPSPTLDELFDCAKKLGLTPVKEPNIAYPAFWWKKKGRLLVRKEWSKSETLEHLAMEYVELRKTQGMPSDKKDGGSKETGKSHKRDYHKGSQKSWKERKKAANKKKSGKKGKKNK